ncbi:CpaF family protein [Aeromicrobium camelliae]|uniref:CpaF family protein n=1 Tax=Aeromicrobium camelliae TaxID=1538144 RepID=UPI001FB72ED8|nr:CpaF family protein [Aeromicrobium camelliae]
MKRQTFKSDSLRTADAVSRDIQADAEASDDALVAEFREKLLEEIDLNELSRLELSQRRARLERVMAHLVGRDGPLLSSRERASLVRRVVAETLGLGVLEPLLLDDSITEIMVNGPSTIFVERFGQVERAKARFVNNEQLLQTIDRIVSEVNRRVDESSPMVDARLPNGERVNVILPPLSLDGPVLTIRKFPKPFTMQELIDRGTLTAPVAAFLDACVKARLNVVVSGGTGSGKTTLLNAVSASIPDGERIVTIEDAAELSLQQQHVIRLESRPANVEGRGQITIRDLVRNSLRMRPDRIIVGEVRGGETMDMLSAMNTGHEGSLTTVHANSPEDAIHRLETLASMSDLELPFTAIREQVRSAVDVIVQLNRASDGTRRVMEVVMFVPADDDGNRRSHVVSRFDENRTDGTTRGSHVIGSIPRSMAARLQRNQGYLPEGIPVALGDQPVGRRLAP